MKKILAHLFEYKTFTRSEAYEILMRITAGDFNQAQIAAFMTAYSMRTIRVEELQGFRDAMFDQCLKIDLGSEELVDLCGTGGDGKNTFNISTLASFVVAGAGYKVAKHGNYGVSSGCGSSNVIEYLGFKFTNDASKIKNHLKNANICFLHAPLFHPAMKTVAPIRRELGVKTFFNMLGPLTNPANPKNQSIGVFNLELARLFAYLLQSSEKNYTIVHALDGYDEISLTGDFKTIDNTGEHYYTLSKLRLPTVSPDDIAGGETVEVAAKIFTDILQGKGTDAQKNVVLTNAAFAIQTIHPEKSFESCFEEAAVSLDNQLALNALKNIIAST